MLIESKNKFISNSDKVIWAVFERAKANNSILSKMTPMERVVEELDGSRRKVIELAYTEHDGEQNLLRCIEVKICDERYLEVYGYISGLLDISKYIIGVRREMIGIVKLPIFTNELDRVIVEAADTISDWDVRSLQDKEMTDISRDKILSSRSTIGDGKHPKPLVDGL